MPENITLPFFFPHHVRMHCRKILHFHTFSASRKGILSENLTLPLFFPHHERIFCQKILHFHISVKVRCDIFNDDASWNNNCVLKYQQYRGLCSHDRVLGCTKPAIESFTRRCRVSRRSAPSMCLNSQDRVECGHWLFSCLPAPGNFLANSPKFRFVKRPMGSDDTIRAFKHAKHHRTGRFRALIKA